LVQIYRATALATLGLSVLSIGASCGPAATGSALGEPPVAELVNTDASLILPVPVSWRRLPADAWVIPREPIVVEPAKPLPRSSAHAAKAAQVVAEAPMLRAVNS